MFVVEFKIETDGDFGFEYIPCNMSYDGDEFYHLIKEFNDKQEAIQYAVKTADFLFSHINGNKETIETIKDTLLLFEQEALANRNVNVAYIAKKNCYGNYDGTEFSVYQNLNRYAFDVPLDDEQYLLVKKNLDDFRQRMEEFAYKKIEEYKEKRNK